jgi:hypothetical protein
MMNRKTLTLTMLLILVAVVTSDSPVAANKQTDEGDEILGVWRWDWTNNRDYKAEDCPGGFGVMTVTKGENGRSISFKGKARSTAGGPYGEEFEKSGSWEYLGRDPSNYNRRKYRFRWSNDTDTVVMGDDENFLRGTNGSGSCLVTGSRQSAR